MVILTSDSLSVSVQPELLCLQKHLPTIVGLLVRKKDDFYRTLSISAQSVRRSDGFRHDGIGTLASILTLPKMVKINLELYVHFIPLYIINIYISAELPLMIWKWGFGSLPFKIFGD